MYRLVVVGAGLGLAMSASAVTGTSARAAEPAGLRSDATYVSSAAAVPGVAPPGADKTAVYLNSSGRAIAVAPPPSTTPNGVTLACTPVSGRDNPHRSSTGVAVSGHGWWDRGSCSNNRAKVYNCLYEWYTDNSWRQKACQSPSKELAPGGGSSNRTVARNDCNDTTRTSWRNHVDVDVIGEGDTGEWPYNQADVDCRVY